MDGARSRRSILLPDEVDAAQALDAKVEHGVLALRTAPAAAGATSQRSTSTSSTNVRATPVAA
jgi:HSP20 family molecular chaperone IbpA